MIREKKKLVGFLQQQKMNVAIAEDREKFWQAEAEHLESTKTI